MAEDVKGKRKALEIEPFHRIKALKIKTKIGSSPIHVSINSLQIKFPIYLNSTLRVAEQKILLSTAVQ